MKCFECGSPVRGRVDKKFCNDHCRSQYHNQRKDGAYVNAVIQILATNRAILRSFCSEKDGLTSEARLLHAGFNSNFWTNFSNTEAGKREYYCFEYRIEIEVAGEIKIFRLDGEEIKKKFLKTEI